MRVKINNNRCPVLEQVMILDDKSEDIYYKDRFRFNLYNTKSEGRIQTRAVEIRVRKAVVFAQNEAEPMMINVFEWINLNMKDTSKYEDGLILSYDSVIETLRTWLMGMDLIAHPMSDEFKLTESEANDVITGYIYRIGIDGLFREYDRIIKLI